MYPANHTLSCYALMMDVGRPSLGMVTNSRVRIVDIHGWCLMNNHYHLLLSERIEGGMSLFLKKINGGYAKYFNERYKRAGALFQGRTKKIHIDTDTHFLHILNYIHLNPLDMLTDAQKWRTGTLNTSVDHAVTHLNAYRWSSYLDYIGIKNFPSILTTSLFQDVFNNHYSSQLGKYLHDLHNETIDHLFLEKHPE